MVHYSQMEEPTPFDSFLQSLAPESRVKYQIRVNQFLGYCQSNELEVNPTSVQSFLVELHEKYMASTLWTIFAILKAYFVNQYQLDLKTLLPEVPRLLKNWEKQDEKTQSKVRTYSFFELTLFRSFRKKNWKDSWMNVRTTPLGYTVKLQLWWHAMDFYDLEIENLQFENIKFENSVCFITINRKKQPGVSRNTFFAIDDPNCVKVL